MTNNTMLRGGYKLACCATVNFCLLAAMNIHTPSQESAKKRHKKKKLSELEATDADSNITDTFTPKKKRKKDKECEDVHSASNDSLTPKKRKKKDKECEHDDNVNNESLSPKKKKKKHKEHDDGNNDNNGLEATEDKSKSTPKQEIQLTVRNIRKDVTSDELKKIFHDASKVRILEKKGRSRGFGFVSYSSDKAATKAKKRTNGVEINNQKISVDFTVTNESKNQLILVHLSPSVTEKAIREYFKQNLVSVKIMKKDIDSHNYRARNACHAVVQFESSLEAEEAKEMYDSQIFLGRQLVIDFYLQRKSLENDSYGNAPSNVLILSHLADEVTEEEIKESYQRAVFVDIRHDAATGKSLGTGLAEFHAPEEAFEAMSKTTVICGREVQARYGKRRHGTPVKNMFIVTDIRDNTDERTLQDAFKHCKAAYIPPHRKFGIVEFLLPDHAIQARICILKREVADGSTPAFKRFTFVRESVLAELFKGYNLKKSRRTVIFKDAPETLKRDLELRFAKKVKSSHFNKSGPSSATFATTLDALKAAKTLTRLRPDESQKRILLVKNFNSEITEKDFHAVFPKADLVEIMIDLETQRRTAYVHYSNNDHATTARKEMDGQKFQGMHLNVNFIDKKTMTKNKQETQPLPKKEKRKRSEEKKTKSPVAPTEHEEEPVCSEKTGRTLVVRNIERSVPLDVLKKVFTTAADVDIPKYKNKPKGFALVTYTTNEEAQKVQQETHLQKIGERTMFVGIQ